MVIIAIQRAIDCTILRNIIPFNKIFREKNAILIKLMPSNSLFSDYKLKVIKYNPLFITIYSLKTVLLSLKYLYCNR